MAKDSKKKRTEKTLARLRTQAKEEDKERIARLEAALKQSEEQLQGSTDLDNDLDPMDLEETDGSDQAADSGQSSNSNSNSDSNSNSNNKSNNNSNSNSSNSSSSSSGGGGKDNDSRYSHTHNENWSRSRGASKITLTRESKNRAVITSMTRTRTRTRAPSAPSARGGASAARRVPSSRGCRRVSSYPWLSQGGTTLPPADIHENETNDAAPR